MTTSTDLLLVGGPGNGMMLCVDRSFRYMPTTADLPVEGVGMVAYPTRKFWHDDMQRWFWIGTVDDTVTDEDIKATIAAQGFQPAWDLLHLPAPETP